jgi:hypothetical protein
LANARSKKHNQTDKGRANKKRLNLAARIKSASCDTVPPTPCVTAAPTPLEQTCQLTAVSSSANFADVATVDESPSVATSPAKWEHREHLRLHLDGFVLDEPTLVNSCILPYVRMVASVLEGRTISREELLTALRQSLRQRSIGQLPRREYVLRYLHQHPP